MLNAGILALRVLPDQHGVDIIVGCLEALYGGARSNISEKVESPTQRKVERNMALADCKSNVSSCGKDKFT